MSGFAPDSLSAFETFTCSICVFYKLYFGIVHVFFCPFHTSMCIVHMVFLMCICCICTVSVLYLWSMHVPCNCKRCILSCASAHHPPNAFENLHVLFVYFSSCFWALFMYFNIKMHIVLRKCAPPNQHFAPDSRSSFCNESSAKIYVA